MKTSLLIAVVIFSIIGTSQVDATEVMLWPPDELAKRSDVIAIGTITGTWFDFRPFGDTKVVDTANLKISEILKGDVDSDYLNIRFYGDTGKAFDNLFGLHRGHIGADFQSGETVLVFLGHEDSTMVMGEGHYSYPNGKYIIKDQKVFSDYANPDTLAGLKNTIQYALVDSSEGISKQISDQPVLVPVPFVEFTEDKIVNTLLPLTDDSDAKRVYQSSKKVRYETNKAEISISAPRSTGLSHYVDYNIYDRKHVIPPDQAQEFVKSLLDKIGYETDGSEDVNVEESYHNTRIIVHQTKDGMKIANEMNRFQFRDRSTTLEIAHWYDNLDEYDIVYSKEDAKNISHDYLTEVASADPKLRGMDVVIGDPKDAFVELKAIDNHLVYSVSRMYFHLEVQVDASTGSIVNKKMIKITGQEIPGCAGIGVSKLTQQDIEKIEERAGALLYYELTDDDLNQLPVLKKMVDATNSRIEYNDRVRLPISVEGWTEYASFFKGKFDVQHDVYYDSDLKSNYVLYDGKIYTVRYNENYEDTPFAVELFPANIDYDRRAIIILKNETDIIPKFTEAVKLIGTWEVSVRNSTGILESEQQRYQSYMSQKNTEKYGADAERYANIFHYNGNYYEPSLSIC